MRSSFTEQCSSYALRVAGRLPTGLAFSFPTTAIAWLLYVMANGESAEIEFVGNDGLVGIALIMGGGYTSSRALIQNGGQGYRMLSELVQKKFETSPAVFHAFLR